MLHKRYEWTRTVFIASVCLTLFLGSQSSSLTGEVAEKETTKRNTGTIPLIVLKNADNSIESNSEDYLNLARR